MSDVKEKIESQIKDNKVILYMKGNREMPQCGFSSRVVQILDSYDIMYETVDVLEDPEIRQGIKDYSNWPTIPQLYVNGEFIGGCDICIELSQSGELKSIVNQA
ncbi:MAG: Grx4 family monothiol glutaredoxin [Candidatus Dadabacteria bacterium]|jgi:monothiol glutaredoxin|nr:Grx4 family monothiol glutaredoxin [Candidatus Dadabacteria bacterium]MCZ6527350.1 Grx4 family monothiol glutaredoxin [Candidatus Dadabacteria bacterium]MCZ6554900.1 Grx4 family monothiol glutaredoxin [Candidatus Dadabacteria bacterium]MCZ6638826.1 Grx4 family monothiol glutaredoxin [Candidatus Dadabacteria bacterium]MCZ6864503.1 Grx4 family monothiol glutaredoxin [Candidatus Dadabacteria bacterium]